MKSYPYVVLLVPAILLTTTGGWADTLAPIDLVTELMMENQGENSAFIGALFGPDKNSALVFSSSVDLAAMAFSFVLRDGSTYRGLPISLSGSALHDATADIWYATSFGTLGSASWTVSGTYTGPVTGDPFLPFSNLVIDPKDLPEGLDPRQFHDLHDLIFYDPKTRDSGGILHFTDIHGGRSTPNFGITDHRNADGTWSWDLVTDTFRVDSRGFSPVPDGGPGAFSTLISPVPEPSTAILMGFALIGLATVARRGCRSFDDLMYTFPAREPKTEILAESGAFWLAGLSRRTK